MLIVFYFSFKVHESVDKHAFEITVFATYSIVFTFYHLSVQIVWNIAPDWRISATSCLSKDK